MRTRSVTSDPLSVAQVCADALPARDRSRGTALDVVVAPAGTPMGCFRYARAMAAHAGLPTGDRDLKIACE